MSSTDAVTYHLASPSDAAACVQFHNAHWPGKITENQWQWQFFGSAAPSEMHCSILAKLDGRIIGTQSIMPLQFIDTSGVYWSAKSEQTLASPEARGRGIFSGMYDVVFRHCAAHEITNIWGYTAAGKAFERVGFDIPVVGRDEWKITLAIDKSAPVSSIRGLAKRARDFARSLQSLSARSRDKRDSKETVTFQVWDNIPNEIESLTQAFVDQWKGATIYRTASFLTWRLKNNPFVRTTIIGVYKNRHLTGYAAIAVDEASKSGSLVDIMAVGDALPITRQLLHHCIDEIERQGGRSVSCWCDDKHPFNLQMLPILRGLGFRKRTISTSVVHYVAPDAQRHHPAPPALYNDYSQWYVTMIFMQGHRG